MQVNIDKAVYAGPCPHCDTAPRKFTEIKYRLLNCEVRAVKLHGNLGGIGDPLCIEVLLIELVVSAVQLA